MNDGFTKTTVGFVTQTFDGNGDCIGQEFIAGDQCDYEGLDGEPFIDDPKENYQPYEMVQPGYDYYILKLIGLIDPVLIGPFDKETMDERIEEYREDPTESQNSFTEVKVTKGAEIDT